MRICCYQVNDAKIMYQDITWHSLPQCFLFSTCVVHSTYFHFYAFEFMENLYSCKMLSCAAAASGAVAEIDVLVVVSLGCLFMDIPQIREVIIILNKVSIARLFWMNVTFKKTFSCASLWVICNLWHEFHSHSSFMFLFLLVSQTHASYFYEFLFLYL